MGFCWIYRRRWIALLASLIIAILGTVPAANLVQTADYKVYFDQDDEQLLASERLGENYSQSDNVLFVLAPKDGNVFNRETLKAIKTLTEASWQIPYSTRVDSITNYQYSHAEGDGIFVGDLVLDPTSLDNEELQHIKHLALAEPNLKNRLISKNGAVTGINVTIDFTDGHVDSQTREVVAYARDLLAKTKANNPELDAYLTGIVLMNNAFPESSEKDAATLIPAMLLMILVGLFLLLRSVTAVFSALMVMLLSIGTAMGSAALLGYKINPVSGASPIIILTVSVAACVHILMSFFDRYRTPGSEKHKSMQEALEINVKSVVLTSITTAIGFASMNFSDAPPFRELGNVVSVGVLMSCLLSLTLLPSLMNILPVRQSARKLVTDRMLGYVLTSVYSFVWRNPLKIVVVGLLSGILLASAAFKNDLNEDFIRYFDESFDVRQSTEFALQNLTGVSIIEYDIQAAETGAITEPAYLKHLDAFTQWLYQQPEVIHVNTFSDTIKRLNKNFNGDDGLHYAIPDSRELIAQYTLLYENSLPFGLGITDRVKLDKSATRLTVTLNDVTNNQLLDLEQRAYLWQQTNFPSSMQSSGLGWSVMFGQIAQKNIASMLSATLLAVLLISAMLMGPFKSLKLGVLSLLPNVLPALVALGIWGLSVGVIGLAASIITALTFGIVVDDSIHLINRYLHYRRNDDLPLQEAIQLTLLSVGKAIVVTSIILTVGFSILATSGFKVNSIIGYLSAVTIVVALVMDLVLLPSLLIVLDRWLFGRDKNTWTISSATSDFITNERVPDQRTTEVEPT